MGQQLGNLELKATTYDVEAGVATITLSRPEALNAWTGRMHHEYRACLDAANRDAVVRAIVVTGAGRAFCAGADTRALDKHVDAGHYDSGVVADELPKPGFGLDAEYDQPFAYHFGILKPIIAAINGPVAGIGLVIACFCDVRFAAAGAKFTATTSRLGLPAEYGLSWVLPRIVGLGHAADLLMTSRLILADEAERIGLVNRTLPADELLAYARSYAADLATNISPASLAAIKRQLYADMHRGIAASVADSEATLEQMVRQPDYREGVRAWLEKRPPNFDDFTP